MDNKSSSRKHSIDNLLLAHRSSKKFAELNCVNIKVLGQNLDFMKVLAVR